MLATLPHRVKCLVILAAIFSLGACGGIISGGDSNNELVLVPPGPTPVRLGESLQFSSTDPVVIWTVIGGDSNGTIDPFGLYQAPDLMPADPNVVIRGEIGGQDGFALIELQP